MAETGLLTLAMLNRVWGVTGFFASESAMPTPRARTSLPSLAMAMLPPTIW